MTTGSWCLSPVVFSSKLADRLYMAYCDCGVDIPLNLTMGCATRECDNNCLNDLATVFAIAAGFAVTFTLCLFGESIAACRKTKRALFSCASANLCGISTYGLFYVVMFLQVRSVSMRGMS